LKRVDTIAGSTGLLRTGLVNEEDRAGAACLAEHCAQDSPDDETDFSYERERYAWPKEPVGLRAQDDARQTALTREAARQDVVDYIEKFYNPKRKHTNTGRLSPVDVETRQQKLTEAGVWETRGNLDIGPKGP
jgi:hypothetical protein